MIYVYETKPTPTVQVRKSHSITAAIADVAWFTEAGGGKI